MPVTGQESGLHHAAVFICLALALLLNFHLGARHITMSAFLNCVEVACSNFDLRTAFSAGVVTLPW